MAEEKKKLTFGFKPKTDRPAPGQTGTSATAAQTGVKPTTAQTGVKPTAAQSGVKPTAAQTGVKPTTAHTGVKPTAAQSGVKPTAAQTGVKPTAAQTGVKPTAAQSGVKPTAAQSGVKPTAAQSASGGFTDVPANASYAQAVEWAVQKGITTGTTETTFSPDSPCHRGHVATFIWRYHGSPAPGKTENPFQDVKEGPFYQAILWATGKGIIQGTSSDTFAHTTPCTRKEVLTAILRSEGRPRATEADAVKWATQKKMLTGQSDGVDGPCTRADMVYYLYKLTH